LHSRPLGSRFIQWPLINGVFSSGGLWRLRTMKESDSECPELIAVFTQELIDDHWTMARSSHDCGSLRKTKGKRIVRNRLSHSTVLRQGCEHRKRHTFVIKTRGLETYVATDAETVIDHLIPVPSLTLGVSPPLSPEAFRRAANLPRDPLG
jgi:hypothetical protein